METQFDKIQAADPAADAPDTHNTLDTLDTPDTFNTLDTPNTPAMPDTPDTLDTLDTPAMPDTPATPDAPTKKDIRMPLTALGLVLCPIFFIFLDSIGRFSLTSAALLPIVIAPFAGLIVGVASLAKGKGKIGALGKTFAIIAIVLPLSVVALVVAFFVGAATGLIALM
ncbi:MAG: hypothetical protein FWH01_12355 [Oscillospiraceae bacterium]|nr:hypothetical protein [Oscillospiraceae bacterium]